MLQNLKIECIIETVREAVFKMRLQKCKNKNYHSKKAVVFVFCSISMVACGIIKPGAGKRYSSKKGVN